MFGAEQFVRKTWAQIRAHLDNLQPTAKILIGSLLVILLLFGFLIMQYVGSTEKVSIGSFPPETQLAVIQRLDASGINAEARGTQLFVAADKQHEAFAALAESRLLNPSAMEAFDDLIQNQSPWNTSEQNRQRMLLAKQKYLGVVIGKFKGVRSAEVIIAVPEDKGFGSTFVRPTASVSLTTVEGYSVNKRLVDAVAAYVSGAVAELRPADVGVIDGGNGRLWTTESDNDMLASDTLEKVQIIERNTLKKIEDQLRYIPGVIIGIGVITDPVKAKEVSVIQRDPNQPLESERTREQRSQTTANAAEPGARPNTGAAIASSGGAGTEESDTEQETRYMAPVVNRTENWTERGGGTEQFNVTVNVPRSYFLAIYKAQNPDAAEQVDEAMLQPIVDAQLAAIRTQIEPLVPARNPPIVRTHMIPDASMFAALDQPVQANTGMLALLEHDWAKPGGLGMLAVLAVGMMFYMLRQANRQPPMPSVEELAGVPPMLPGDEDELVGEAAAIDPAMDGVELDETQIRIREIADQISEMVKANPEEAGELFSRWIRKDE
jgi:flagellar M-ring protein FliF